MLLQLITQSNLDGARESSRLPKGRLSTTAQAFLSSLTLRREKPLWIEAYCTKSIVAFICNSYPLVPTSSSAIIKSHYCERQKHHFRKSENKIGIQINNI